MHEINPPSTEHPQFDAICGEVEDWEPLPVVGQPEPSADHWVDDNGPEAATLERQILAGLITPY